MSEKEKADLSNNSEVKICRVTEVDQRRPSVGTSDGSREFSEAVAPAADAGDVMKLAISANAEGEPAVSLPPPPPPGVQVTGSGSDE